MSTNCLPIVFVFRTISILTLIFLANMYSPIDNELMNTKYDASERSLVCRGSFILYFGLGKFCTWLSAWKWNPPEGRGSPKGTILEKVWKSGLFCLCIPPSTLVMRKNDLGWSNFWKMCKSKPTGPWMSILTKFNVFWSQKSVLLELIRSMNLNLLHNLFCWLGIMI